MVTQKIASLSDCRSVGGNHRLRVEGYHWVNTDDQTI